MSNLSPHNSLAPTARDSLAQANGLGYVGGFVRPEGPRYATAAYRVLSRTVGAQVCFSPVPGRWLGLRNDGPLGLAAAMFFTGLNQQPSTLDVRPSTT